MSLSPEDLIVAATDPDHSDQLIKLASPTEKQPTNYAALAELVERLVDKPMTVRVRRQNGEEESIEIPVQP